MSLQGAADGVVPVHRHGNDHVGGGEHPEHLQVFHQATQEVRARKTALSIPNELGQHLGEEEQVEEGWSEMQGGVCASVCVSASVCVTWNSATTRSATHRLSMNWCSGLWCRLLLSNTTSTSPLPSSAITKIIDNTTTSAIARRASRSHPVTFVPAGVTEAADQSIDGYESVTMETDMFTGRGEERGGEGRRAREQKTTCSQRKI